MSRKKLLIIISLHVILAIYSISGILSKMASRTHFLDLDFCLYYCGILLLLGFYAIVWQQIIKEIPLTVAFANKAITVVWGIIWGIMFFDENIMPGQIIGALLIMVGIILYSMDAGGEEERPN